MRGKRKTDWEWWNKMEQDGDICRKRQRLRNKEKMDEEREGDRLPVPYHNIFFNPMTIIFCPHNISKRKRVTGNPDGVFTHMPILFISRKILYRITGYLHILLIYINIWHAIHLFSHCYLTVYNTETYITFSKFIERESVYNLNIYFHWSC